MEGVTFGISSFFVAGFKRVVRDVLVVFIIIWSDLVTHLDRFIGTG